MGLFSRKQNDDSEPTLFDKKYAGFRTRVYANRIECNDGVKRNIPIAQVANIGLPPLIKQVIIETTGGQTVKIAVGDRKAFRDAVFQAMSNKQSIATSAPVSSADELKKFAELHDSGVITEQEYETKKKQLLG